MLPLEKLKTSSDNSLRMFRAFAHLFTESRADEQMSGIKFCHDVFHSNLTIEINVAFSLVNKN